MNSRTKTNSHHSPPNDNGITAARSAIAAFKNSNTSNTNNALDLQQLALTDSDLSTILPDLLDIANHLKKLDLFMNNLTCLPKELSKLNEIKVLNLGCNPLKEIEQGLFEGLSNLEELDIGFGQVLENIPHSIKSLQALRLLYVGNNRVKELPGGLFECGNLEEIHAYGNCLNQISSGVAKLKNLRVLNVGRNQIQRLPEEIGELGGLEELLVYENDLEGLPRSVAEMSGLRVLNVDGNLGISALPKRILQTGDVRKAAAFYCGAASSA